MLSDSKKLKIVLIGDSTVGKTCLLQRYADCVFESNYNSTLGVDFRVKYINFLDDIQFRFQIWDTSGQERFKVITQNYYRGSDGVIICFDLTNRKSFINIKYWIDSINNICGDDIVKILIGLKSDILNNREIKQDEINKLSLESNIPYFEVSSKTDSQKSIEEIFNFIAKIILDKKLIETTKKNIEKISVEEDNKTNCLCDII